MFQHTDMSWSAQVVQSIVGRGGDMIRRATNTPPSGERVAAGEIADNLVVDPSWVNSDYRELEAKLGEQAPKILYSAMFVQPLEGTDAAVEENFGTTEKRAHAMRLFAKMVTHLVEPRADTGPSTPNVAPIVNEVSGSDMEDPVGDLRGALAMPDLTDRRLLALLLLTSVVPHSAIGVRTYIENKLGLHDFHAPLLESWVEANTPLSMSAWDAIERDVGGFDDLPKELHTWYSVEVPFRQKIALAMTQPNAFALLDTVLPAPGILGRRAQAKARHALLSDFPSLNTWLGYLTARQ